MKNILKSNKGFTLVEVTIALALFTIVGSAIVGSLMAAQKNSYKLYESKPVYESTVGTMDEMLDSDTSAVAGDPATVSVSFPTGDTVSVSSKVIRDSNLKNVAIVKAN